MTLDVLPDRYGELPCVVCGERATAVVLNGEVTASCRRHLGAVAALTAGRTVPAAA